MQINNPETFGVILQSCQFGGHRETWGEGLGENKVSLPFFALLFGDFGGSLVPRHGKIEVPGVSLLRPACDPFGVCGRDEGREILLTVVRSWRRVWIWGTCLKGKS